MLKITPTDNVPDAPTLIEGERALVLYREFISSLFPNPATKSIDCVGVWIGKEDYTAPHIDVYIQIEHVWSKDNSTSYPIYRVEYPWVPQRTTVVDVIPGAAKHIDSDLARETFINVLAGLPIGTKVDFLWPLQLWTHRVSDDQLDVYATVFDLETKKITRYRFDVDTNRPAEDGD